MRMKQSRIKAVRLFEAVEKKDSEANTYTEYNPLHELNCIVYDKSGSVSSKMYGEKTQYTTKIKVEGSGRMSGDDCIMNDGYTIKEGYAVAIDSYTPNYKIKSLNLREHLFLEVEKI